MRRRGFFGIVACLAITAGCWSTTVRSGRPINPQPVMQKDGAEVIEYAGKWHHGFIAGMVEVGGNYNLEGICPNGWAELQTETSFVNLVVSLVSVGIYTPQSVTIRCSTAPMPQPQPPPLPENVNPGMLQPPPPPPPPPTYQPPPLPPA